MSDTLKTKTLFQTMIIHRPISGNIFVLESGITIHLAVFWRKYDLTDHNL